MTAAYIAAESMEKLAEMERKSYLGRYETQRFYKDIGAAGYGGRNR
jgi:hypothetical protein